MGLKRIKDEYTSGDGADGGAEYADEVKESLDSAIAAGRPWFFGCVLEDDTVSVLGGGSHNRYGTIKFCAAMSDAIAVTAARIFTGSHDG